MKFYQLCIIVFLVVAIVATAIIAYNKQPLEVKVLPVIYGLRAYNINNTGSMYPSLGTDSMAITKDVNFSSTDELVINDVYVYRKGEGKLIVHRFIYAINDSHALFKGDANRVVDKPVHVSNVIRKVVTVCYEDCENVVRVRS